MKRTLTLSIVILTNFFTYAQKGELKGQIIDKEDQSSLQFVTVKLFQSDSILIAGQSTDELGRFHLENLPYGTYNLQAKFMGYNLFEQKGIVLTSENKMKDLGLIEFTPSADLNTVEVKGEKALMENHIDKKVFNADQSLMAKGGTAIDLMRQVPTITVDENDNVLLRGDGNVTILIDGRPVSMPISQLLPQIPASSIEKIEIITNPSAKYDPEGMSGIINIIMKKEKLVGVNGTVTGAMSYGNLPKYRGGLSLNYRNQKVNIYSSYNYNWRKIWFGGSQDRDVLIGDTLWDFLRQTDYGERINYSHNAEVGADFFVNDYNTLYVSASYMYGENLGSRLVDYNNVDADNTLLYNSQRDGRIDAPSTNLDFNGGWQKSFKKEGHSLDLDFNHSSSDFYADENLSHQYFDGNGNLYDTQYQNTLEDQYFSTMISKLDYVLPINDSTNFEAGFHYTRRFAKNDFTSESSQDGSIFINDLAISNAFQYLQQTFAPYTTFGMQLGKFGLKLGLRAEQTLTNSKLITTDENYNNDYFKLFPSAHFSYTTSKRGEFMLSYSKRINRPSMGQINPFSNYSDPLTLQTGNPFLRPEIIHVNEFSYNKFWKKFNVNSSIYYRYITDLIRRNLTYTNTYSEVSFANLGSSSLSGADLTLTFTPMKGLRIMSSTSAWMTSTKDTAVTSGQWNHYLGLNTGLNVVYQHKAGWTFQYWTSYSPNMRAIQGTILYNYGMGGAVQKTFLNKKLSITLSVTDVLKTRRFAFESYDLGNYTFNTTRNWESRRFTLSLNYRFGKMTKGKTRRNNSSSDQSDDRSIPDLQ